MGVYPDGVWLVELAPLSDPELVPKAVASALELPEQPNRQLTETLVNALRSKLVLLVLDNCEHLVDVCASLAEALLSRCLGLRILASSRERQVRFEYCGRRGDPLGGHIHLLHQGREYFPCPG